MTDATPTPLIALSACVREIGIHPFHVVGEKYITAVRDGAGGFPLLLPSLGEADGPDEILAHVDGLLFTGSPSNIEPHIYGGPPSADGTLHDTQRDSATLPLLRAAHDGRSTLFSLLSRTLDNHALHRHPSLSSCYEISAIALAADQSRDLTGI